MNCILKAGVYAVNAVGLSALSIAYTAYKVIEVVNKREQKKEEEKRERERHEEIAKMMEENDKLCKDLTNQIVAQELAKRKQG